VAFDVWMFADFCIDMCDSVLCEYWSTYAIVCNVINVFFC
jgi:hypothetical protein